MGGLLEIRVLSRGGFLEDEAELVDVRCRRVVRSANHLRGHVGHGSHEPLTAGDTGSIEGTGQTEVYDLLLFLVGVDEVLWFQIPMKYFF